MARKYLILFKKTVFAKIYDPLGIRYSTHADSTCRNMTESRVFRCAEMYYMISAYGNMKEMYSIRSVSGGSTLVETSEYGVAPYKET